MAKSTRHTQGGSTKMSHMTVPHMCFLMNITFKSVALCVWLTILTFRLSVFCLEDLFLFVEDFNLSFLKTIQQDTD